jgi:hypothetical protein
MTMLAAARRPAATPCGREPGPSPVVRVSDGAASPGWPRDGLPDVFEAELRALVGETARITRGTSWISAVGPFESVRLTFNRSAGTVLVVAQVRDLDGREHRAADVVRHISPHELVAAATSAIVRVVDAARLEAETRERAEPIRRPQPPLPPPPPG